MRHHNTLLHAILKNLPWAAFDRSVDTHAADRGVRTLPTKNLFIALLHGQLSGASSLREIVATMESHSARLYHLGLVAPRRSTLADANESRPAGVFVDVFNALLAQAHPGLRRSSKEAVRLIDASSMTLSALSSNWASYEARATSVKMHIVFDPDAATPVHFAVTPGRINDIVAAKTMPIEDGATYVFDLGYYDFAWWAKLIDRDCRIVTRLKKNTLTRLVEERTIPPDVAARGRIIADRIVCLPVRLKGTRRHPLECKMREIHVVIDTGKTLRIISNDLKTGPEEIADLYKTRWQIELFFRWVKQTLKVKKFLGLSENAIRIQIAVALIAYLLLRIAHNQQRAAIGLLNFARIVRANLMHFKAIHELTQTEPIPKQSNSTQMRFAI